MPIVIDEVQGTLEPETPRGDSAPAAPARTPAASPEAEREQLRRTLRHLERRAARLHAG